MDGFVWRIVLAQACIQIGAYTLPALLPDYIRLWALSKTEAGWLIGVFFAAYVCAVPVLVSLTDRFPARRVYLVGAAVTACAHLGFALAATGFWSGLVLRALAGLGWAGAYMPGLKAITETLEGNAQSRAVSVHAAGVGIAGAGSFAVAGLVDSLFGPSAAFAFGGCAALVAFVLVWGAAPRPTPPKRAAAPPALLDFRPVFRNRAAMGWITGYTVHTLELAALRAWAVTFLTVTAARLGAPGWLAAPTLLFTAAGMAGIAVSILGNETAQRFSRTTVVTTAMVVAAALALTTGWMTGVSVWLATALVLLWNAAIYLDSSALTAGTVQAAEPDRRGATMGLHSMAGYAGGFLGPLTVGLILDLAGEDVVLGWGLAFGHLAAITLPGLFLLRWLGRPRPACGGDR